MSKEQKTILGYACTKATINFKNGSQATVWYLPQVKPSITENDWQFGALPGLVLEYESFNPATQQTLRFSALRLDITPVPTALFEPPLAGYRLLN
jgi:GLPGLI family protein